LLVFTAASLQNAGPAVTCDRLQAPSYLRRFDHNWKISARKLITDVGKYSFANRNITDLNQLTERKIGLSPVICVASEGE
jgi:hypothetical protein